jgi:hypothetical protein
VVCCSDSFQDWPDREPLVGCQQKQHDGCGAIVIREDDGAQASLGVGISHNRNPLSIAWARGACRE